ncbi:MAG TPA: hypothetical protein VG247_07775 [Pseudonocardiaceae bacterium]|jgi:hypothetical protein|nr:hypothetical protein [Pseudonocardiaceae bacterium]
MLPVSATALLIVLCVLAALAGLLRWSYGSDTARPRQYRRRGRSQRHSSRSGDFGLLREIAIVPSHQAAQYVQDQLRRNGIRSTTAATDDRIGQRILVFPSDVDAATAALLHLHEGE